MADSFEPIGLHFFDNAKMCKMCLVTEGNYAGWLCYKQNWVGGNWVTLRRATQADREALGVDAEPVGTPSTASDHSSH